MTESLTNESHSSLCVGLFGTATEEFFQMASWEKPAQASGKDEKSEMPQEPP